MAPIALLLMVWLPTAAGAVEQPVELEFYWSERCPHCRDALPFVTSLRAELPWLRVQSLELTGSAQNRQRFAQAASVLGVQARSVPAFVFCGQMLVGYRDQASTGTQLRRLLEDCRAGRPLRVPAELAAPAVEPEAGPRALWVTTLVLAGLDAFNPCAFFVLLSLLSLLVNARERRRILVVGGLFVAVSAAFYFLAMAAWMNLFLWFEQLAAVTLVAGLLALLIGALNVKDYVLAGRGPSLSIAEGAKPGLFRRMRGLLEARSLALMMVGAATLAVAANSYELLCTAGFPMVYTRILTLAELPLAGYYGYLVLYNLVYVTPLAAIVALATLSLGRRKLSARAGRLLKLVSGSMMLGLGALLVLHPEALGSHWSGLVLLALALGVGAVGWIAGAPRRRAAHGK